MKYITSAVTGERKETITIATEKRLQNLMKREHQSNEAKFLTWALKEYKCIKGCGSASIKEIRKYAAQEDWLRNDFGFDTDGYMIETSSAMNIRFSDYMTYWCRLCYSSLDIKDFNGLVKAIYDMTDEYGYINYPEEESETKTSEEVVESAEETTVPETATVETEIAEKYILRLTDEDGFVFCIKVFVGTSKEADEECERIMTESALTVISPNTMPIEQKDEREPTTDTKTDKTTAEYQTICTVCDVNGATKSLALAKWNRRNSGQAP